MNPLILGYAVGATFFCVCCTAGFLWLFQRLNDRPLRIIVSSLFSLLFVFSGIIQGGIAALIPINFCANLRLQQLFF
jgi:hypothetical protein